MLRPEIDMQKMYSTSDTDIGRAEKIAENIERLTYII